MQCDLGHKCRIVWLDIVKGIGILLIMLSHVYNFGDISKYLFSFYIPLFYLCGGYTLKNLTSEDLFKRKSKRLLYPYFIYGILFTFLYTIKEILICYAGIVNITYRWFGIAYGRLTLFVSPCHENIKLLVDGPLWFLPSFFTAYLFAYLILKSESRQLKSVLIISGLVYSFYMYRLPIYLPWCLDQMVIASFFILIGYFYRSKIIFKIRYFILAIILYIALVIVNGDVNFAFRVYGRYGFFSMFILLIIGVCGTYIVYGIAKSVEYSEVGKILAKIGKASLRLMCIHIPIFEVCDMIVQSLYINLFFKFIITLIVSIIIGKICEKVLKLPISSYL